MISKLDQPIVAEAFEFLKISKFGSNIVVQRTPVKIPFILPQRKNESVVIGKKEMRYTILSREHDRRTYGGVQMITTVLGLTLQSGATGHWPEMMCMAISSVRRSKGAALPTPGQSQGSLNLHLFVPGQGYQVHPWCGMGDISSHKVLIVKAFPFEKQT